VLDFWLKGSRVPTSAMLWAACVPTELCIAVGAKGVKFLYYNERVLLVTKPGRAKANGEGK
jgi:hypothetical protein